MVSAEREPYNRVWGTDACNGSRDKNPEAERLFALSQPEESANLS